MEYGNQPRVLAHVGIIGALLGVTVVVGIICVDYFNGNHIGRWDMLLYILFGAPLLLIAAVLPTVAFHIRVGEGRVQHVFLGSRVISDYPLKDFERVGLAERGCAAVLHFRNGKRIHFFGAHQGEVSRLLRDLRTAHTQGTPNQAL